MFWKGKKDNRRNFASDMNLPCPLHTELVVSCVVRPLVSLVSLVTCMVLSKTLTLLTSHLSPSTGVVAAGLGRTGNTRGLTVSLVLTVLWSRGCPRYLAGPQHCLAAISERQHDKSVESLNTRHSLPSPVHIHQGIDGRKYIQQVYNHNGSFST